MIFTNRLSTFGAALFLSLGVARAEFTVPEGFGLGFMLGAPSGLSASLPIGANNAFNFVAGYELVHRPNLVVTGNYVWHRRDLIQVEVGKCSFYYGPGARLRISSDPEVGLQAVVGIDYFFEGTPIQALFEIGPGINILPDTRPNATAGLGLRYFF
jgi:hypothetical protein